MARLTGHGATVPVEDDVRRPTIGQVITTIRQALMPGRPTQRHVEWAIRIFLILAIVVGILILLVRFGLVSSEDVTLVAALIALNGVVIAQVVNARIAEFNQRQQQEVAINSVQAERAQTNERDRIAYLRSLALLSEFEGDAKRAIEHLHEAHTLAEKIGLPGELWQIQSTIGELHERRGEAEEAREAFSRAAQILRMLAGKIGDEKLREGFLAAPQVRCVLGHTN